MVHQTTTYLVFFESACPFPNSFQGRLPRWFCETNHLAPSGYRLNKYQQKMQMGQWGDGPYPLALGSCQRSFSVGEHVESMLANFDHPSKVGLHYSLIRRHWVNPRSRFVPLLPTRTLQDARKGAGWATSVTWSTETLRTTRGRPASAWSAVAAWPCPATAGSKRRWQTTSRPSTSPGTGPCGWASTTFSPRACTCLTTARASPTSSGANTSCRASRTAGGGRTAWRCRRTTATGGTITATAT